MRVAVYARVSTTDQSTEMQLRDLRDYCKARGWEIHKEYVDHGVSGSKASRPALDELMAAAPKRKFQAVIVWRFDRFARSTKHLVTALSEFQALGIQFISFNENIDTSGPMGQAIFTILSAISQLERDMIRERVKGGLRNAKAKGKRLGRPMALAVRDHSKILALREQGKSIRFIATQLGVSKSQVERTIARNVPNA